MIPFNKFYTLNEAKFRDSKQVKHIYDVPMFSIYAHDDLIWGEEYQYGFEFPYTRDPEIVKKMFIPTMLSKPEIKNVFAKARNKIHKIGFPSMHANIVFNDLSDRVNRNTGGGTGGYASQNGKYMVIDFGGFDPTRDYAVDIIVHEWAHLWMFNNSSNFKKAVEQHYKYLIQGQKPNISLKPETTLPVEIDSLIFKELKNTWIPMVEQLFTKNTMDNTYMSRYIATYNKLSLNDVEYLPHNSMIYSKSKRKFSNVEIGDEIYAVKVATGWIIGNVNKRSISNEVIISFDELLNYMDMTPSELEDEFNRIKIGRDSKIELKQGVYSDIHREVERAFANSISNLGYGYYYDIENSKEFIDNASLILLPPVLKYLRNIVKVPILTGNVYDKMWATPANGKVSYMKEISRVILEIKNNKAKTNLKATSDLSGSAYNDIRSQMKDLVGWATEYGMSNNLELWATGIEQFLDLPMNHRKAIIDLMRVTGEREISNRRLRKHEKKSSRQSS